MQLNQYEVTGRICVISGGLVQVNAKQHKRRAHNLQPLDKGAGIYEVMARLEFKHGEVFGHDADLRKLNCVKALTDPDAEPDPDKDADPDSTTPDDDANPDAFQVMNDYSGLKGKALAQELKVRGIIPPRGASADDKRGLLMDDDAAKAAG